MLQCFSVRNGRTECEEAGICNKEMRLDTIPVLSLLARGLDLAL
jgi:hypothetical protein